MKKIITTIALLFTFITTAQAYDPYASEEIRGTKKHCYYASGAVITVDAGDMCPMSFD